MPEPLAYHLTWTAYGTWLSGDARGWVSGDHHGINPADAERENYSRRAMVESRVFFSESQRTLIRTTVEEHCRIRGWHLFAINVLTNHIHIVVSGSVPPEIMMNQFKAWCSRRLSDATELTNPVTKKFGRRKWFTEHGSTKWINTEDYLAEAIHYVLHGQ